MPFVGAVLHFRGQQLALEHVLVDTGSGGSVFSADRLFDLDLRFERGDPVHRIRGVGGAEFVFAKKIETILVGDLVVEGFEIEVGAMDYGFPLDGILGVDFLRTSGAVLDLHLLKIGRSGSSLAL